MTTGLQAGRRVHHQGPRRGADPRHDAWVRALEALEADVEAVATQAARGLGDGADGADEADEAAADGAQRPAVPGQRGVPWTPPLLDVDYLQTPAGASLRERARRLRSRQNAVTSLLMTAMAVNRRHRAVLERAEAPHDRAIYFDQTS